MQRHQAVVVGTTRGSDLSSPKRSLSRLNCLERAKLFKNKCVKTDLKQVTGKHYDVLSQASNAWSHSTTSQQAAERKTPQHHEIKKQQANDPYHSSNNK